MLPRMPSAADPRVMTTLTRQHGKTPFRAGSRPGTLQETLHPAVSFTGNYVLMADVSEFQPNVVDAAYVQWSHAVGMRALYGSQHDDGAWYGGDRRTQFHASGIRFLSIYQYLVAGQSGKAQAQAFKNLVGAIRPGEVFVADFEEGQPGMLTDWYNEMLALYGAGIKPYLWSYSGLFFGETTGALPVEWLAAYESNEPASPHVLWQFSSGFTMPGVGSADCSVFHGTMAQLEAKAYQGAKPPVPTPPSSAWTFSPVRLRDVVEGRTSALFTFDSPSGYVGSPPSARPGVARYEMAMSLGTTLGANIATYPRHLDKSPDSAEEEWQVAGLQRGKTYTYGIRAQLADGSHSSDWVKGTITTG